MGSRIAELTIILIPTVKMRKVTIILSIIATVLCQYQSLNCFRIEHASLWNGNIVPMTNASSEFKAVVPWTNTTPNIFDFMIVLIGFKLNVGTGNFLSYWVDLKVSDTQGLISLAPFRGKILSINFMIALITLSCSSHIEFIKRDYNCTILNQHSRTTVVNEQIMLLSANFNFNSSDYVIKPYITAIQSSFITGTQVLQISFQATLSNTNNFTIYLRSFDLTHIVDSVSFSVFLFAKKAFTPSLAYFFISSNFDLSNFTFQQNLGIPDQFYKMGFRDKCLIGFYRIAHKMNVANAETSLTIVGHNISGILMNGVDMLVTNTICLMQCDSGAYNTFVNTSYICQNYPSYVMNCISSDSKKNCVRCKDNYVLISAHSCSQCNGTGWVVEGGCTTIVGCLFSQKIGVDIYPTVCLSCEAGFYLDFLGNCLCVSGWLVTGNCINMLGCIATKIQLGLTVCSACSSLNKYKLVNNTCICIADYQIKNGVCMPVCGDGKLMGFEECDDGNTRYGDGCGGCLIQVNFKCGGGTPSTPSICRYIGKPISIAYVGVDKATDLNQAIFTFKVSPPLSLIGYINFTQYFYFQSLVTHSVPMWSYQNSVLTMQVDYQQNLEATAANFTFTFDAVVFHQMGISLNVTIQSSGLKLVMMSGMEESKMLGDAIFYMMVVVILIVAVGSAARKMIGVEMLITYQLLYFVHLKTTSYNEFYSKFKLFSYLVGNPHYLFSPFSNIQVSSKMNKLPFSYKNSQITLMLILFLLILLLIIYVSCWFIHTLMPKQTRLIRVRKIIYDRGVFPLLVGVCIPITLIACQLKDIERSHYLLSGSIISLIKLILCLSIYLVVFYQIRSLFCRKCSQTTLPLECKPTYIPTFILFLLASLISIVCASKDLQLYFKQYICLISFLMLCWQLKISPYYRFIHNAGIFLHKLLIILFCVWSILRESMLELQSEGNQMLVIFIFVLLLLLSLIVNIVRTIASFKEDCSVSISRNVQILQSKPSILSIEHEITQRLKESMVEGNPYFLQTLRQKEILNQCLYENQESAKEPLVHSKYNEEQLNQVKKMREKFKRQVFAEKQNK